VYHQALFLKKENFYLYDGSDQTSENRVSQCSSINVTTPCIGREHHFLFFYLYRMLFVSRWQVGVPGSAERADILQKQLSSVPCSATTEELTQLADAAHGYVGADLAAVCKEAGKLMLPLIKEMLWDI